MPVCLPKLNGSLPFANCPARAPHCELFKTPGNQPQKFSSGSVPLRRRRRGSRLRARRSGYRPNRDRHCPLRFRRVHRVPEGATAQMNDQPRLLPDEPTRKAICNTDGFCEGGRSYRFRPAMTVGFAGRVFCPRSSSCAAVGLWAAPSAFIS